ncbi:phosphoinositide 3-kinase adapter protein 1 isoform X7 [Strongylocentrotus purpuratus]|uniref:DBB domain-containing protein n=1 Tax=Strongylocentrotus purpuratus TaxID=7668 RepID=A0A7M7NEM6_STRPU|nr:phosphoinositide 3-kinase adapter protein 1 isoform X7 [Strongylocentrotus purpuratus]
MAVPGADTVYDLTILYMSDVTNWCEYLFDIFNPFEVYQQSEEITTFPTHESTIHHIKSSRVQVLIISPKFIETATAQIREITGKNSVVGLLCGVEKEELVKLQDRIPDYVSWHLVDAKDGPRCITGTTLDIVDEMIKLADQQAPPDMNVTDEVYLTMTGNTCREQEPQSNYMQMGRGLHHGTGPADKQDDLYQLMSEGKAVQEEESNYLEMNVQEEDLYLDLELPPAPPADDQLYLDMGSPPAQQQKDEEIYLDMDDSQLHNDDTYDCPVSDFGSQDTYDFTDIGTLPTRGSQVTVVPDKVRAGVSEKVVVIFTSSNMVQNFDGSYKIHIAFDQKKAEVVARVLNPHTLRFDSPADLPGGMYKCTLTHNGSRKATFKLGILSPSAILSDILSKSVNPLNYLCEVLDVSPANSNQLDNELHEQCKKYMPQGGFRDLLPVKQPSSGMQSTLFPTALHFAAKFGLPCVCAMLCEWPGADQALRMKNIDGKTPDQMTMDEGVKSFLLGNKERSVAQQQGHGDIGYVTMTQKEQQQRKAMIGGPLGPPDQDNPQNRPAYDFPFPVAIPVSKEADIHRLISGDPDDIYNYYDSWERSDTGTMERDGDDDDDDDTQDLPPPPPIPRPIARPIPRDTYSGPTSDYETLDSEAPSVPHHDMPPSLPVSAPDERPEPPAASRKPVPPIQPQSDNKDGQRDPDAKLQSLIDIQNRVKDNEISMDEAVNLFREWEESHNHTQSMSTRRGTERESQSSLQKLFKRKQGRPSTDDESDAGQRGRQREPPPPPVFVSSENKMASQQGGRRLRARSEPVATGFTSLTSKHHKEAALRSVSANSYGIAPSTARGGRGADISERPERSPTSLGSSRLNAMNGSSENSNGPSSDTNRNENGSKASPMEPPPPRSPRPHKARDPAKRVSYTGRNQGNFSQDYIDRPIPPIPPRNTSAAPSNYSRLPGARPVFAPDQKGRTPLPGMVTGVGGGVGAGVGGGGGGGARGVDLVESDAIPEHSEHTAPPTHEGIPERMAPLPPRRSSNEPARSTLVEPLRRQSEPAVPSGNDGGGEPTSPSSERDASGKPKRPVPRPRAPRPR